jgi:small subunit ribosomal protein S4
MSKLGQDRSAWKIQRALLCELPGLGKPGAMERRPYPPGQHGMRKRKFSEYASRLREKQKLVFHYVLREEQLRRFVKKAKSGRATHWMATLIGLLETRLDNLVFRTGLAPSIASARQLVSHGKVRVNGKKLDIPSALIQPGSEITLVESAYVYALKQPVRLACPDWIELRVQGEMKAGKLKMVPGTEALPFPFDERLVVEYYSSV